MYVLINQLTNEGKLCFQFKKCCRNQKEKQLKLTSNFLIEANYFIRIWVLWYAPKNDAFANKNGKLYLEILKQFLGVNKQVNNIKFLAEAGQLPLSINIKTLFKIFTKIFFH